MSTAPGLDAYIDEESNRSVSFEFHDVGGFSNETLQTYVWVEAVNDGTNGQPLDGISQLQEYEERPFFTENDEQRWFVNVSVNDTSNANLQTARVLLVGADVAGYAVRLPLRRTDIHAGHLAHPARANSCSLSPRQTC